MPNTRWRHHSPQPVSSTFISTTFGREPRCSRRLSKAGPARVGSATRAGHTCLGPARLGFEPCVAHPPPCRGTLPAGVPYAIGESRPDCCCDLARPLARPPPARPRRREARGRPAAAKSDSTIGASIMRWSTRTPSRARQHSAQRAQLAEVFLSLCRACTILVSSSRPQSALNDGHVTGACTYIGQRIYGRFSGPLRFTSAMPHGMSCVRFPRLLRGYPRRPVTQLCCGGGDRPGRTESYHFCVASIFSATEVRACSIRTERGQRVARERLAQPARPSAGGWPAWTTSTCMGRMTRTRTCATDSAHCSNQALVKMRRHRLRGQPALRRPRAAPSRASGCPEVRPASATQPLGPRWPATHRRRFSGQAVADVDALLVHDGRAAHRRHLPALQRLPQRPGHRRRRRLQLPLLPLQQLSDLPGPPPLSKTKARCMAWAASAAKPIRRGWPSSGPPRA